MLEPPFAARIPRTTVLHGDTLEDPYFWLREKENPAVRAYLNAENEYAEAATSHLNGLAGSLYDEMLARIQEDDTSAPYRFLGYDHWVRTVKGQQYPIYHRRRLGGDEGSPGPVETTLDVNELASGRSFMSLGAYAMSDDGQFLAYSTDDTGFRQYTLQVKNLAAGALWSPASNPHRGRARPLPLRARAPHPASIAAIGPSPRRCTRWSGTISRLSSARSTMGALRCGSRNTRERSFSPTSIAGFYAVASPDSNAAGAARLGSWLSVVRGAGFARRAWAGACVPQPRT